MKVHVGDNNNMDHSKELEGEINNISLDGGRRCRRQTCRSTARVGEYCEVHALQKHDAMILNPDLYVYLNDSSHRSRLQSWFLGRDDKINVNRMLLWYAIDNFKSCSSPELRKSRSKQIYKKYLSPNANFRVRVHTRVEELCQSSFDTHCFIPSEILYQVQGAVFLSLERIFLNAYISSKEFITFAKSQKKKLLSQKEEKNNRNDNNTGQWSLPGELFRNKNFVFNRKSKKSSLVENYKIGCTVTNMKMGSNEDPLSLKEYQVFGEQNDSIKQAAKITKASDKNIISNCKIAYDTTRNLDEESKSLKVGLKKIQNISLIPRSAKVGDTGLLITPRSSRLEEMDEASAALIVASFGGNVARRTTK